MGFLGPVSQGKDESRLFKTTDLIGEIEVAWPRGQKGDSLSALAPSLFSRSSVTRGRFLWALPSPSCSRSLGP